MIIVTSLNPSHICKENQSVAIASWNRLGKCFSLNDSSEIKDLDYKGIRIIRSHRTISRIIGKPLITINAIIDFAIDKKQDLFIVNSDIIISGLPELRQDGVTLFSRYDYTDEMNDGIKFEAGFDGFYIPYKFLGLFSPSVFSLGAAWHDYWTPFVCIHYNIPLYQAANKHLFHKKHATQYNHDEWLRLGEYFRWEFEIDKFLTVPQVATKALNLIKSKINVY